MTYPSLFQTLLHIDVGQLIGPLGLPGPFVLAHQAGNLPSLPPALCIASTGILVIIRGGQRI